MQLETLYSMHVGLALGIRVRVRVSIRLRLRLRDHLILLAVPMHRI